MESKLLRLLTLTFIFASSIAFGQVREISGTVFDENNDPLPGANVIVKGTTNGTTTDFDGNFFINANEGDVLEATFIGYALQAVKVTLKNNYKITIYPDAEALDEVIVVAYGTAKKESFTGSAGVVGTKELEQRTISSVTQALEGSTTGLQVTSGSGQPGSAPQIRVRGFGTLNGSADPLYIVDGAQFEGSLASISPDDIQSMTILKDASSTALYGARAANGVIMITTKQGRNNDGKVDINFKAVAGVVNRAIPYYETVGAKNYYELQAEAYKNSLYFGEGLSMEDARAEAYTDIYKRLKYNPFNVPNDQIVGSDGKINPNASVIFPDLNWYDPLEQVGYRQNYNVSASGGGEKHNYFFSLGYLDETGYMINSDYNRINTRINLNMTPKKWLKIGTNFSGSMSKQGQGSTSSSNTGYSNPFYVARNMGPIYPVYIVDPATGKYILDAAGEKQYDIGEGYPEYGINARPSGANNGRHVIAELNMNNNVTLVNNLSNRSFAQFTIIDGLTATINASVDINNYKDEEYENDFVGDGAPAGRYNETRYTRTVTTFNQLINYNKTFGDHTISVLLGHESFNRNYTSLYGMKSQQIVEGIYEFDNFVTPTSLSGSTTDKRNEGYFSNLKYDYKNKYYISGSYRYDGSSVFHQEERWGGFYSVGVSWRVSEEEFIQKIDWISSLKIRASYGEVGNDNLDGDYYAYQALYATRPNGLTPGLEPSTLGNDLLTWESNKSSDIGVEFGLFDGRLTGSFEYYNKISDDLLYFLPVAPSQGLEEIPMNVATLVNSGFELGLNAILIQTDDFKWDLGVQASTVNNEITKIPKPFINGSKRWQVGHSIYDFFLYDYYGVNADTGAPQYHKWEEDPETKETSRMYNADGSPVLTEDYTEANKGYTGDSSIPTVFGSVTNGFSYKGFRLDVFMTYSIGGKILDYSYASLMNEGSYGKGMHVDQNNGWRNPGDKTNIPRLEVGNNNINPAVSDRWLTDASYFTLKNVNFSYNFDRTQVQKMGLGSMKLFVTGENLIMTSARTGMNPQQSFGGTTSNVYLPSRVFSLGVNVGF